MSSWAGARRWGFAGSGTWTAIPPWRPYPAGGPRRKSRWTSKPPSRGFPTAPGRCSCCTTSRAIDTRRSPTCSVWPREPRSRSCTGRGWRCAGISSGKERDMSDQWTDRLSEYLDDELPPDERAALEAHLRQCAACGAVLADLKRIVTRARGLEDRLPDHDLWPGIATRIGVGSGEVQIGRASCRERV